MRAHDFLADTLSAIGRLPRRGRYREVRPLIEDVCVVVAIERVVDWNRFAHQASSI